MGFLDEIENNDEVFVHKEMEVSDEEAKQVFNRIKTIQESGGDIREVIYTMDMKGVECWSAYVLGLNVGREKLAGEAGKLSKELINRLRGDL